MKSTQSIQKLLPIFTVSLLTLFVELFLIRYLAAEVRAVSFFTNLVVMASFLGIGIGALLARWRHDLFFLLGPGLLLNVLAADYFGQVMIFPKDGDFGSEWLWLQYFHLPPDAPVWNLTPIIVIFFVSVALALIPLGQRLGRLLQGSPSIQGYSADIAGSLGGAVLFALLSFAALPPWLWLAVILGLSLPLSLPRTGATLSLLVGMAVAFVPVMRSSSEGYWSPYYKVEAHREDDGSAFVFANSGFIQLMYDFREEAVASNDGRRKLLEKFQFPYKLRGEVPQRVVVLGAGTGNDLVAALRSGVAQIDAVEIDPGIQLIGRNGNPSQPYSRPEVRTVLTDGRRFLARSAEQFDLIVFGTVDSSSSLSGQSSLRQDNFLYTVESLQAARDRLAPDGLLVILYSAFLPWISDRLEALVQEVFGEDYKRVDWSDRALFNVAFVAGNNVHATRVAGTTRMDPVLPADLVPTDDWPYLLLRDRKLPPYTAGALAIIVLLSSTGVVLALWLSARDRLSKGLAVRANWAFFMLGAGFLLLETRSLTEMALLYGSTWVVNSVVFSAIFIMILLANGLVFRWRGPLPAVVPLALLAALLLNYLIPVRLMLDQWRPLQTLVAILFVGLPIFFAALMFGTLFQRAPDRDQAFGFNLLGAMAGGIVEYSSIHWGFKALSLLAIGIYLVAWQLGRREWAQRLDAQTPA